MNFKKAFLTFLSVVISVTPCYSSVTPCYSNAIKESDDCESLPVNQSEEIEECVICLDPMKEGEEITTTKCNHKFHKSCWDKWCSDRPIGIDNLMVKCPLCRTIVSKIRCPFCGMPVTEEDCSVFRRCGHAAHWSCTLKLYDFLQELLKQHHIPMCVDYCYDCYARTGNNESVLGHLDYPVSPEKLRSIAIRAYPELEADLGQQKQAVPVNLENQQVLEANLEQQQEVPANLENQQGLKANLEQQQAVPVDLENQQGLVANLENRNSCSRRSWKYLGLGIGIFATFILAKRMC